MTTTTHFNFPLLAPSQAQPEVPVNETFAMIDAQLFTGSGALSVTDHAVTVAAVSKLVFEGSTVTAPSSDAQFSNVALLMHMDGSSFVDSSASPLTIAAHAGAAISADGAKFGSGCANFPSTGYLQVTGSTSSLDLGAHPIWTIELWINPTTTAQQMLVANSTLDVGLGVALYIDPANAGGVTCLFNVGDGGYAPSAIAIVAGVWTHIAVVCTSGVVRIYTNGVSSNPFNLTAAISPPAVDFFIGSDSLNYLPFVGQMDELRVTLGVARYSANFTPPTAPFANYTSSVGVAVVTTAAGGGGGSALELTDGTHDLTGVSKITVSGATVGGSAAAATLTISGGGGAALAVTDGTTSVASVTTLTISGAMVTSPSAGHATATIAASAGGGGSANNIVSIDTHPAIADPMDDEFDAPTLNSRWTWLNQGTQTVTFNHGQAELNSPLQGALSLGGIMQPCPAGAFRVRAKLSSMTNRTGGAYVISGMFVNTAGGNLISIDKTLGANTGQIDVWTSPTAYSTAAVNYTAYASAFEYRQPCWFEIERDATNLYFRFSQSGYDADFVTEYTTAISGFAAANVGIFTTNSGSSNPSVGYWDWFRREA